MHEPNAAPTTGNGMSEWLCYFCPRVFLTSSARASHMRSRHQSENRMVPPQGFKELHERREPRQLSLARAVPPVEGRSLETPASGASRLDAGDPAQSAAVARFPPGPLAGRLPSVSETPAPVPRAAMLAAGDGGVTQDDDAWAPHAPVVGHIRVPSDGFARGSLALPRTRNVFQAAVASRIRAYYESMPEASRTRRLAPPHLANIPSLFDTQTLQRVLEFALTCGGPGLAQTYQRGFWSVLTTVDSSARSLRVSPAGPRAPSLVPPSSATVAIGSRCSSDGDVPLIERFPSAYSFVSAIRAEQQRVLSKLHWDETPIEVEGVTYVLYSRDILHVVLDLVVRATTVQLWGKALGNGADGTRQRSCPMDSDLLLDEQANLRRRLGDHCFVLAIHIFIDEAVVSWSGAHYIYPIRIRVLNILDGGSRWVTVGYIPHVPKPVGRTAAARRVASDSRNALLQRCLAVALRRFTAASIDGVPVHLPGGRSLQAFPRVLGLVSDQLGERAVMCLMGSSCTFFCSHCMVRREVAGSRAGLVADRRDVSSVVNAQMDGALARDMDPRPSQRNMLRLNYSSLAFVPAVAAVWGLTTDQRRLYDIICFDILHVWKLGVVRMVAQRFPAFLAAACAGGQARLGPVPDSLQALNLRSWELGHLCVPTPSSPGYVSLCKSVSRWVRGTRSDIGGSSSFVMDLVLMLRFGISGRLPLLLINCWQLVCPAVGEASADDRAAVAIRRRHDAAHYCRYRRPG